MILIKWQDEFSVGVTDIDYEHREMINLINGLHHNLVKGAGKENILDFLGEIYKNISAHFALEEKLMLKSQYAEYSAHKREHEKLLAEIRDIMDAYEDEDYYSEKELSEKLNAWFTEHFKTMDARLHKQLD